MEMVTYVRLRWEHSHRDIWHRYRDCTHLRDRPRKSREPFIEVQLPYPERPVGRFCRRCLAQEKIRP